MSASDALPRTGLTIGSVCSGIGGFDLGFEQAGHGPVRWQIERDPYRRLVLERHWPNAKLHRDLQRIDVTTLAPVDLLIGGTPCQDLSVAGRGAGLIHGKKSSLWFRMLAVAAHLRPPVVVWENVAGSIRRGMDRVVADLANLGYTVVGTQLSASDVGAPHLRKRVFLVAVLPHAVGELVWLQRGETPGWGRRDQARDRPPQLGDDGPPGPVAHGHGQGELRLPAPRIKRGNGAFDSGHESPEPGRSGLPPWPPEPAVGRVAHGVPQRSHRMASLGDAIVPRCAFVAGCLVTDLLSGAVRLPSPEPT